jgi:hypothetical protein
MPVRLASQLCMAVSVCGLLLVAAAQGAVKPHTLFADGAVLQQASKCRSGARPRTAKIPMANSFGYSGQSNRG